MVISNPSSKSDKISAVEFRENQTKHFDNLIEGSGDLGAEESRPEYKQDVVSTKTFKELDIQSIFRIISKANYKGKNKELKEKLVRDLNSIIQREISGGIEAFGFDAVKTFILQVASRDAELKEVSNKIIKKLEEAF